MAVFVWKGEHGAEPPPPCTPPGTFADVPCPDGFAVDFIEGIFAEGITAGCEAGPPALYCPDEGIPNSQMAVFLVKAFEHSIRSASVKDHFSYRRDIAGPWPAMAPRCLLRRGYHRASRSVAYCWGFAFGGRLAAGGRLGIPFLIVGRDSVRKI